jgi:CO/xanthine dehydrogenase Mo-binding subunit
MGGAVRAAAEQVREQLLSLASESLEASPDDLETRDGRVYVKGDLASSVAYSDLILRKRMGNLIGQGRHQSRGGLDPATGQSLGPGPGHWHQGSGAAEIEVDVETGKVELLRYHAGVFVGRIINPVQAELQTEGNVGFGIGQALYEEMVFDNGQLQNSNLGDYMIASVRDMPGELELNLLENASVDEIHGIGETSLSPIMPAIANAVYRATGVRIQELPVTPEKILAGLRAADAPALDDSGST